MYGSENLRLSSVIQTRATSDTQPPYEHGRVWLNEYAHKLELAAPEDTSDWKPSGATCRHGLQIWYEWYNRLPIQELQS